MRRLALICVAAAVALGAPAAHAGSVSVFVPYCAPEQSKYGACYPDEARFAAKAGEVNAVTVTSAVDPPNYQPKVTITDAGAPLEVGPGCTRVDEHTATCTGYSITPSIDTGDGDDTIEGPGILNGGAGNDTLKGSFTLTGGPGDDRVEGGDGSQRLQGGPGKDTIIGGAGDDRLEPDSGEAGERDELDGGDGADTVGYTERRDGMTISLDQPAGNEDGLVSIENVDSGVGADSLTGDGGRNTLSGGPGTDSLAGGDGDDLLAGGDGRDRLSGGAGNDTIDDTDRSANSIDCGTEADRADPGVNTLVGPDCEELTPFDLELVGRVFLRLPIASARTAFVSLTGASCLDLPCKVRMTATVATGKARGTLLASLRRVQRKRRPALPSSLRLRLAPAGFRALTRAKQLTARVTIAFSDGGELSRASFLIPLSRG